MTEALVPAASLGMSLLRPALFSMDAEEAHHLAMGVLARVSAFPRVLDALASASDVADDRLRVRALSLELANPLGVAAGLDKDAVAIPALAALGFGSVEAGTVTPRPQPGNPRPRVFRLPSDGAVVNRMGFPSEGAPAVARRLAALRRPAPCVVGVNVGKNKETPNERAEGDYVEALASLAPHADYVAVNVSSPNTPGLRALQDPATLRSLVEGVGRAARGRPVVVKLSPDMDDADFDAAADACLAGGAAGVVVANTTLARPAGLRPASVAAEAGGLSGAPLLLRTEALVRRARARCGEKHAVIGVGGISSADDAWRILRAGADLVQVYTAFVYAGPALPRAILRGLVERMEREGVRSIGEIRR